MGRRPGSTTKSGRFMNPADQERKSMRQKELKRNKKQRTMVRHAILKSKDVDEIIENLKRLDEQEFDIHVEHHSKYVFNEKRAKLKQTFNEVMNLYKQEKREDKIKELIEKMDHYEMERARKIQQYNAQRFSLETNPVEIPLPDGSSLPNAAMTPIAPSIPAHYLMPQARAGILKHTSSAERDVDERGEPPGPPVGLPPLLKIDDDYEVSTSKRKVRFGESETKVIHDGFHRSLDDDYGPVDIPAEVMQQESDKARHVAMLAPPIPQQPLVRAPPLPPNMLPPPPRLPLRMPPPPPNFPRPGIPGSGYGHTTAGDSVISAAPVVRRPAELAAEASDGAEATISAEPKLRDLTKEVTRFVPTALRTNRNKVHPKRPLNKQYSVMGVQVESAQRKEAKDTDEAYADFMKEVSSLL
ncbi:WW domain-binding protein 11 [Toxocara canis]|uniref:WW domain-binding protein 11 n=1 Tax=Toxocara canis TaxID=6265 RepID=A0A0B2UZN9_TOXCA|nr:WW domain-binding protein 11 [Toxocara canis]